MSAARPLVSVIVRSMARPSLAAALASIARQQGIVAEVLVIAAVGAAHPPPGDACGPHALRLVGSRTPLSRPAAANAGLDAATGDWITFLDDDDIFLPGHLAGLLAARADAPDAGVIHSYARAVFADGRAERFGQPFSLMQLFDRSFIHLSAALVARRHVAAGARFDESLEIHEDWDFFLQLAQQARFQFVPCETFEWHADAGTSGAAGGANHDGARFAMVRDRVYAKWSGPRDALIDAVAAKLRDAVEHAQRRDLAGAEALARDALAASPNDPWALNTLAMVQRVAGRLADARATQELAVAVRPQDATFVYNLALLCRALGDAAAARACCGRALTLAPEFAPARLLRNELSSATGGERHRAPEPTIDTSTR